MNLDIQNAPGQPVADADQAAKLADVAASLGNRIEGDVRFDTYTRMLYSTDASIYQIEPLGVVLPRTEGDVQCVLEHAQQYGLPVLPRGGGSSLAGQAVGAAIVLDFSRYMNQVIELNVEDQSLLVQPGMNLFSMNQKLKKHGLMIGPDPASANRATIGGCVGNNSAGSHSILYGMMMDNVQETEVWLADASKAYFRDLDPSAVRAHSATDTLEGTITRGLVSLVHTYLEEILHFWPRHWRRTSGYALDRLVPPLHPGIDPAQLYLDSPLVPDVVRHREDKALNLSRLMVGSEGTLGVVTAVRMGLVPTPAYTGLVVLHFDSVIDACAAVVDVLDVEPSASELLDKQLMDLARSQPGWDQKLFFVEGDPAAVLLTEFYGADEREVKLKSDRLIAHMRKRNWHGPIVVIADPAQQAEVWELRKSSLNLLMGQRGQHKPFPGIEDVSVPTEHLASYMEEILAYCRSLPDVPSTAVYAHASAGCLHVRPLINLHTARGAENLRLAGTHSLELTRKYHGVMSGEHGDGLARSYYNQSLFTPALYRAQQEIKALFDPKGLLNPGKVVDAQTPTENLRFGADYRTQGWNTVFDWRADHGFAGAVEMCNGAGVCRKIETGTMCPSFMATREEKDSTRGRANALRNAMSGRIPHAELWTRDMYEVLDLCLGCKACKSECPSSVDMARIKAEYLQGYYDQNGLPLFNRLMGAMPQILRVGSRLGAGWSRLANLALRSGIGRAVMQKAGVHPLRQLPPVRPFPSSRLFPNSSTLPSRGKVCLLVDTWARFFDSTVAVAAVELLTRLGFQVEIADRLPCCGRPLISGGQVRKAQQQADRLCHALHDTVARGIPVIGLEPSCLLTLRDEYRDLATDRELARTIADNAYTLEEFLDQFDWEEFGDSAATPGPVWLHGHCHQKALVGNDATTSVLRKFGFAVNVIPSGCCGMAGEFGYVESHYEISQTIGEERLFPAVRAMPDNGILVASGFSCREQIGHFTDRAPLHLAEVLNQRV